MGPLICLLAVANNFYKALEDDLRPKNKLCLVENSCLS